MDKVIWKFPLDNPRSFDEDKSVSFRIEMPQGAEFRLFGFDEKIGNLCVWYEIDLARKDKLERRTFFVAGTGQVHSHPSWLASCLAPHGYVFHLYQGPTYRGGE